MKMKFITLWLSLICILFFIIQSIIPGFTDALILNQSSLFQPWRFLTSIFLHGSLLHLVSNLFALILFGFILEKLIGSARFLAVFFVSGIFANIISFNFYPSSLGASGAIMGIIGCLAIIRPMMTVLAFSLPMPMFIAAILWILGDIFGVFSPDEIGHIAHLSGILFGAIFGIVFRIRRRYAGNKLAIQRKINIPEDYMRNWERIYMNFK